MDIVTTPEAIITAAVLISALAWAVTASIMAYNRGRSVSTMAERHNSVVDTLRKTEVELSSLRDSTSKAFQKHRMEVEEVNRDVLMGLQRIDQLTADRDRLKELYTEASYSLKSSNLDLMETDNALFYAAQRMRIPNELRKRDEFGRFVKMTDCELVYAIKMAANDSGTGNVNSTRTAAPKPTPEKSEGLAEFTEMMDNAIEQLNGLKIIKNSDPEVAKLCDEVKANAVNDIDPRTEAALEMGRTMGNSSRK